MKKTLRRSPFVPRGLLAGAALALLLGAPGYGQVTAQFALKAEKSPDLVKQVADVTSIVYKKAGGKDLKMYIYRPKDIKAGEIRPAMLNFHGGGWLRGGPSAANPILLYFVSRGLICVDAQYRLLPDEGNGNAKGPQECLADAKSAMRWVRTHAADYQIDPDKIIAGGTSAGGHLAAALPTIPGYDEAGDDLSVSLMPQAVVLLNPAFDLVTGWGGGRQRTIAAGLDPVKFSPTQNITTNMPPFLIQSGSRDGVCPPGVCREFVRQVTAKGGIAKFVEYPGERHGFYHPKRVKGANYDKAMKEADVFLQSLGLLAAPAPAPVKGKGP